MAFAIPQPRAPEAQALFARRAAQDAAMAHLIAEKHRKAIEKRAKAARRHLDAAPERRS